MPHVETIVVGGGIAAGAPLTTNHFLYLENNAPPTAATSTVLTRAAGPPEATVNFTDPAPAATERLRISGGFITQGASTDSVLIGRTASATANSGVGGVVIGTGAVLSGTGAAGTGAVVIGRNATITDTVSSPDSVVIGVGASSNSTSGGANNVVIGAGALGSGFTGVVIGSGASLRGPAGAVVIGNQATSTLGGGGGDVVIGNATSGAGFCTIVGDAASSAQGSGTAIGRAASVGATFGTAIGRGASISAGSLSTIVGARSTDASARALLLGADHTVPAGFDGAILVGYGINVTGFPAANYIVFGDSNNPPTAIFFSGGVAQAGFAGVTMQMTPGLGNNNVVGSWKLIPPLSTGNANGGDLEFQTGARRASGSTLQTATTRMTIVGAAGNIVMAAPTDTIETLTINGVGGAGQASLRLNGLTNGAAAQVGTLNNSPVLGDPTFWIPVSVAGVTKFVPAW